MSKLLDIVVGFWGELDSVIELFVYLAIAYAIQRVFGITYLQSIAIVFGYFLMNLMRVALEIMRNKHR